MLEERHGSTWDPLAWKLSCPQIAIPLTWNPKALPEDDLGLNSSEYLRPKPLRHMRHMLMRPANSLCFVQALRGCFREARCGAWVGLRVSRGKHLPLNLQPPTRPTVLKPRVYDSWALLKSHAFWSWHVLQLDLCPWVCEAQQQLLEEQLRLDERPRPAPASFSRLSR